MKQILAFLLLLLSACAYEGRFLEPKVVVVETQVQEEEVIVRRTRPRVITK